MGSVWIGFASLSMLGPPPNELETQSLLGVFRHAYSAKALRTAFCWRCPAMLPFHQLVKGPYIGGMILEPTDEQTEALIRELSQIIENDRYPSAPAL
jgi:hypothetical protein